MMDGGMSRGEREDLQRLIRQREKILRSAAKQRSAELLADFENQLGSTYSFDSDAVWAAAAQLAEKRLLVRALRGGLFVFDNWHRIVERVGCPVTLGAAVVVNQEITRHACHPSGEAAVC